MSCRMCDEDAACRCHDYAHLPMPIVGVLKPAAHDADQAAWRARVEALEKRVADLEKLAARDGSTIDQLLDRVNQLVEFHGIRPIRLGKPVPGVNRYDPRSFEDVELDSPNFSPNKEKP